jgi:hypothetical protein
MGSNSVIPAAAAGAASLLLGLGLPKVIEGMPPWVSWALVGVGVVLLLVAAGLRWVRFGSAGPAIPHNSASVGRDGSALAGQFRDVYINAPPVAPMPKRRAGDWPIADALAGIEKVIGPGRDAWREFRRAARDGEIQAWGRPERTGPEILSGRKWGELPDEIPPDYWKGWRLVGAIEKLRSSDRPHTEPEGGDQTYDTYTDVTVDRAELENRWLGSGSVVRKPPMQISTNALRLPDMTLAQLTTMLVGRNKPVPEGQPQKREFYRKVGLEIADAVKLRHLTVWARSGDAGIDQLDDFDLRGAKFNIRDQSLSVPAPYQSDTVYRDVKFNRDQVMQIWPRT